LNGSPLLERQSKGFVEGIVIEFFREIILMINDSPSNGQDSSPIVDRG
jgi:hypothetical protein